MKKAPVDVLEGGLAHELSHIIIEKRTNENPKWRDFLAYRISKKYKALDERNTDVEVILRGYGPKLLSFLEYAEKLGFPHYKEDGLSIRELQKILGAR